MKVEPLTFKAPKTRKQCLEAIRFLSIKLLALDPMTKKVAMRGITGIIHFVKKIDWTDNILPMVKALQNHDIELKEILMICHEVSATELGLWNKDKHTMKAEALGYV